MRIELIAGCLLAIMLAGCVTPQKRAAEIRAANPAIPCYTEVLSRASLQPLRHKMGFAPEDRSAMPLTVRNNSQLPDDADITALEEYWGARSKCVSLDKQYMAESYPPVAARIRNGYTDRESQNIQRLHNKAITFGGFIAAQDANQATLEQETAIAAEEDQRLRQANRQRALEALSLSAQQNAAQQQLLFQQQQNTLQQMQINNQRNRPVTTNCNRFGNQVNCTSY